MRYLVGSLGIKYDVSSWGLQRDSRCLCSGHWEVEFRPPPWLCARRLVFSGNRQILFSLRSPRILLSSDALWNNLSDSAQSVRYQVTRGATFYPDDQTEGGQGIMAVRDTQCLMRIYTSWTSY
jgi:hypothetical protein